MKIKEKLLKLFVTGGGEPSAPASEAGTINRQQLLDQICNHFLARFKEETTSEGMLFPTSFCIYLHEKDYRRCRTNPFVWLSISNKHFILQPHFSAIIYRNTYYFLLLFATRKDSCGSRGNR